ncbi:MAG: cytochrome C oxidase subunit IV family protein [Anaerolineae bacterium]|nr:cytochrome C oxidase subunit IV family protein [Anaerolineae bacterium]
MTDATQEPQRTALTPTDPAKIEHAEHKEGNEGIYFSVFVLLVILTLAEVLVTYIPGLKEPLLIGLMLSKAWLVAQFFMHLRYDNKILSWTFVIPLVMGFAALVLLQPLMK